MKEIDVNKIIDYDRTKGYFKIEYPQASNNETYEVEGYINLTDNEKKEKSKEQEIVYLRTDFQVKDEQHKLAVAIIDNKIGRTFCLGEDNDIPVKILDREIEIKEKTLESKKEVLINKNEIAEIIQQRNLERLCHFTPKENLKSIIENGLMSLADLEDNFIRPKTPDPERWDGQLDKTSLTISEINRWLYNVKKEEFDLIIIYFDIKLLLDEKLRPHFCPDNAAKKEISHQMYQEPLTYRTKEAFQNMFLTAGSSETKAQAELLVQGKISVEYITEVHTCDNPETLKYVRKIKNETSLFRDEIIIS